MKTWNVNVATIIKMDQIFRVEAETEAEAKSLACVEAKRIAVQDYYKSDEIRVEDLIVEEDE